MKPMITNGGPHPADKWADMTTDTILELVQVKEDSVSPEATAARAAKRDLRPVLFNILNAHHEDVQRQEQDHCKKNVAKSDASEHAVSFIDPSKHLPTTLEQIDAALAATPFAAHFAQPDVKIILSNVVGQHTADVMHIERRWHEDRLNAVKGA